jgi:5'(3')-deoxyribonucleotidase
MTTRPIVLLDCDGVLADFVSSYLEIVRSVTGKTFTPDDVTGFDIGVSLGLSRDEASRCKRALGESRGFCESLAVYPEAQDGVARLQELAEVYVVTSPWNSCPTWTHEREAWLHEHFGIPHRRVIHTSAKHLVRGDVFVDDKTEAVQHWSDMHPDDHAVVWETPHNRQEPWNGTSTREWRYLQRLVEVRAGRRRVEHGLRELVANTEPTR